MRFQPKLTLKTIPGAEPVTVSELAAWGGGLSVSDPLLAPMLSSSREMVESYLGAALITQTWQQFYDLNILREEWWDGIREGATTDLVCLPRSFPFNKWPIASVTSVTFYDETDIAFLSDPATYYVDKYSRPSNIALRFGFIWPVTTYRVRDACVIECITGYGAAGASVPEPIKSAIKALAAYSYDHRGECEAEEAIVKSGAYNFLRPYKARHV